MRVCVRWTRLTELTDLPSPPLPFAPLVVDSQGVGFTYTFGESDLISWYKQIISANKLRIVVYNGDTDPCINSLQAQDWTSKLGFAETQSWRPWTTDGCQRMSGYVTRYENDFDFVTIRGSGHMVPTDKPQASLSLLSSVLTGQDYARYDPTCSGPTPSV